VFIRAHPWLKKSFNKSNKFRGAVYLTVNRNKPHFIRVLIRENQFNPSNPCPEKGTRIKRIRPMGTDFSTGSPAEGRKREGKGVYSPSFIERIQNLRMNQWEMLNLSQTSFQRLKRG